MTLFHRKYLLLIFGVLVLAMVASGGAILLRDWQVAHRSHSVHLPPVNWLGYDIELFFAKAQRKLLANRNPGLPQVRLYISEQAQKALLSNVPASTKKWQRGYRLTSNRELKRVKVRHRGDNPANWMFGRKSWRVKSRKKDVAGGVRTYDYISPQGPPWDEYFSYLLAQKMGVRTPKVQLVELFINDESSGIILERERLDESFLRNSGFMPINLYKGEQFNIEAKVRVDDSLFNNPGLWSKSAIFNQKPDEDFSDLERLISSIRRAETSGEDLDRMPEIVPFDEWASYAAFQIVGGTFHNDWIHNMRIALDPWSGYAHPIPHDLSLDEDATQPLDLSTHDVFRILNMQPSFLLAKYRKIFQAVELDNVISAVTKIMRTYIAPLKKSLVRDIHVLQDIYHHNLDRGFLSPKFALDRFKDKISAMEKNEKTLAERMSSAPEAEWRREGSTLFLSVDGELPVGRLFLTIPEDTPTASSVTVDADGDGKSSSSDVQVPVKIIGNQMVIDAIWFAERLPASVVENGLEINPRILTIRKTRFRLIFPEALEIQSVSAESPFTFQKTEIPAGRAEGAQPSPRNMPLLPGGDAKPQRWSGTVRVEQDLIVRFPVVIEAGTKIIMAPGASLVFRKKLFVEGDQENPVKVLPANDIEPWGAFALVGPGTKGSVIRHLTMSGGSGGDVENLRFVGMLSIHNTSQIVLENLHLSQNRAHDDLMHVVYVKNLRMTDSSMLRPMSDGLDVDLSEDILIQHVSITDAGNDAVDLMGSNVTIAQSTLNNSGDKGISVGEESRVLIVDSVIERNAIGVESKDGSLAQLLHVNLIENATQISAYKKNWRYGKGGRVDIRKSILISDKGSYSIKNGSELFIRDSILVPILPKKKRIIKGPNIRTRREDTRIQADYGEGIMAGLNALEQRPDARIIGVSQ